MASKLSTIFGSPCWARTSDIMINSHALWQSGLFTPKAHPNGLCKK